MLSDFPLNITDEQEIFVKEIMTPLYEWGCLKDEEMPKLPYNEFKEVLAQLINNGFIGVILPGNTYITAKGIEWVEKHDWCPHWN